MKHLVVHTHLNPQSFTKAVTDEVIKVANAKGHTVKTIDLYADGFDPVLKFPDIQSMFMGGEVQEDVKNYQEMISWADHLTFVYPMWWGQMPAMLKGFIDRVFANGFAFSYGPEGVKGFLTDKTVRLIINTSTTNQIYSETGMHEAQVRINDPGIFGFCGMKTDLTFFGNITTGTDEERKAYLASVTELV